MWDVDTGQQLGRVLQDESNLFRAYLSPDGKQIATTTHDGYLRLFAFPSQTLMRQWKASSGYIRELAFSPDGHMIATGGEDRMVRVWDSGSGAALQILAAGGEVSGVQFSPNGKHISVLSSSGGITIWKHEEGRLVASVKPVVCCVWNMAFSPDSKSFAFGTLDGSVHVVSTETGKDVRVFHETASGWAFSTAFSGDGTLLVTGGYHGARVWDTRTGDQLAVFPLQGQFQSLSIRPDSQQFVAATDQSATVWDRANSEILGTFARPWRQSQVPYSVSYSPDGRFVLMTAERDSARLWASEFGSELHVLRGGTAVVEHAAFSPDGNSVVTVDVDGFLRLWDSRTGSLLSTRQSKRSENAWNHAYFSPDGRFILLRQQVDTGPPVSVWSVRPLEPVPGLTGSQWGGDTRSFGPDGSTVLLADKTRLRIVELRSRTVKAEFECPNRDIGSPRFSNDGRKVAAVCGDGTPRIFDASSGRLLRELSRDSQFTKSAIFSPDGRKIAVVSDGVVSIWDLSSGTRLFRLGGLHVDESLVDWSPNGKKIVATQENRLARIFDGDTGQVLVTLRGHDSDVVTASFSPDGGSVLTASNDGTARLWDAETGQSLSVLRGHKSYVHYAAFSPDGRKIVTVSSDETARQYYAKFDDLLNAAISRLPVNLAPEDWELIRGK